MMEKEELIRKYNVPGPRYTSYPTVPAWDSSTFNRNKWEAQIINTFQKKEEISLYIHLPYCESLCTFCGCNTRITVNHAVEAPYINAVLKEWSLYLRFMKQAPVIKELHLGGGTPTFFHPNELKRLILGITKHAHLAKEVEMSFEGHPNNTTREHLQTLYDLGFRRVSYGVQDFNPDVQEVIHRIQPFEKVKQVMNQAKEIGYTSVNVDLVYGLPLQNMSSMADTINKVNSLRPDRIAFYSYAHVPWVKPGQRKFTELDLPDDEEKRALYEYGRTEFEKAGYQEIGMDHFALSNDPLYEARKKQKVHRNFMGYTTSHTSTLIGLGVSSISDLWGAYAQNEKTIEAYKQRLEEGVLPVFRGHCLSKEDLILRRHIQNIMCRFETSWEEGEQTCIDLFRGLLRMEELEEEGLVEINYFSLKVTPAGRPFIRNICMALDVYYQAQEKKVVQYSKVI